MKKLVKNDSTNDVNHFEMKSLSKDIQKAHRKKMERIMRVKLRSHPLDGIQSISSNTV